MNTKALALGLGLALLLSACGGDDEVTPDGNTNPDASTVDATPLADAGPPQPPVLGTQIDRTGRPAINTALNDQFNPSNTERDAAKDAYNRNSSPSTWQAMYAAEFRVQLAVLDALDSTSTTNNCGNQLGITLGGNPPYVALAGLLADDQLYVNSTSGSCGNYLGVEANALGILVNNDCGGREMSYDVILTTYSVLASGSLGGVDDGITTDDATHSASTFPFLAAPL